MTILKNPIAYVASYIGLMILTYILPYFGPNSAILNTASNSVSGRMNPLFWFHLMILIALCASAWYRGGYIDKKYFVIFPILALVFDLVLSLSLIPLVPTVMHLLVIILGVMVATKNNEVKAV
jgi:hypothetical protein